MSTALLRDLPRRQPCRESGATVAELHQRTRSACPVCPPPDVDEVVAAPLRLLLPRDLEVGPHDIEQGQVVTVSACELQPSSIGLVPLVPAANAFPALQALFVCTRVYHTAHMWVEVTLGRRRCCPQTPSRPPAQRGGHRTISGHASLRGGVRCSSPCPAPHLHGLRAAAHAGRSQQHLAEHGVDRQPGHGLADGVREPALGVQSSECEQQFQGPGTAGRSGPLAVANAAAAHRAGTDCWSETATEQSSAWPGCSPWQT